MATSKFNEFMFNSPRYQGLKARLRQILLLELEGGVNPHSQYDLILFERSVASYLAIQQISLGRMEHKSLIEDLWRELSISKGTV